MKKFFILLITLTAVSIFSQDSSMLEVYDNLQVNAKAIPGTTFKINEEGTGVYTLDYTADKNQYRFMLTLFPISQDDFRIEKLQDKLKEKGNSFLSEAEEKAIVINTIYSGTTVTGYYYGLTDKNPRPEEYKYFVQGFIKYKYLIGYFTFLYNGKENIKIFNDLNISSFITDNPSIKKTRSFEKIKLTENDIKNYRLRFVKHFYSRQQALFYNNPETYESILPAVEEKYTQSISTGSEEGTVFYYCFKNKLDSGQSAFLKGLFYGDTDKPSEDHPEMIIIKDNYLIVFSYPYKSSIAPDLFKIISKRLN